MSYERQTVVNVFFKSVLMAVAVVATVPAAVGVPGQADPDGPLRAEDGTGGAPAAAKRKNAGDGYVTPGHLRYPYLATKFIKPIFREDEPVTIGWYVTDWRHSLARFRDDSPRFDVDLRYSRDDVGWKTIERKDVRTGDGEFVLGKLPCGTYTVGLKCLDRKNGLPSFTVWHEFRVEPKAYFTIPSEKTWRVTAVDAERYGLRSDPGHERRVLVEMADYSKFSPLSARQNHDLAKIAAICKAELDRYLAAHPHREGKVPGYTVYIPALKGNPTYRAFQRCRIVTDAAYDAGAVEQVARANSEGLQRMMEEAVAKGIRRIVLPKAVYRVSHAKPLEMPAGLELDLNGATLKLNGFTGFVHGFFRFTAATHDSALVNGTLEGDYYTHDYEGTPGEGDEAIHNFILSGSSYCRVEKVVLREAAGYCGGVGLGAEGAHGEKYTYGSPGGRFNTLALGKTSGFTRGGLDWRTGAFDAKDACRYTTKNIDLARFKPWRFLSLSKFLGYQGILTRNWNYTVCFYDEKGSFLSGEVAMQYRDVFIPKKAVSARFSIEVASLEEAENCKLVVARWKIPWNCTFRGCRIERGRCCGFAPAANRNFLFEDNEFCWSGEALVSCAIDCEDGWDQSQDTFFIRNRFHDNPQNDFVSCSGHNMVLIGNRGDIGLYPRSFSPVVVSNDCRKIWLGCANRNRTGYWRYDGNRFDELFLGDRASGTDGDWFSVIYDRVFTSADPKHPRKIGGGATGVFHGCTFDGVAASPGSAVDCTIRNCTNTWTRYNGGRWKNCRVENSRILQCDATNSFKSCTFRNSFLNFAVKGGFLFDDCTFENVSMPQHPPKAISGEIKSNCRFLGKNALPGEFMK